jgi:hypothetical protein
MTNAPGKAPPPQGGARDYSGPVRWEYRPQLDGAPDPGEIVWTWVAYEDEPDIGKDRPVVIIGRATRGRLAVLMLSTRDHSADARWLAIGPGDWDEQHRLSWVRGDRILAVVPEAIRREGSVVTRQTYESIRAGFAPRDSRLRTSIRRLFGRSRPSKDTPTFPR